MKMRNLIVLAVLALAAMACQQDKAAKWSEMDLLQHGFPITVMAPDSAKVTVADGGIIKDITIDEEEQNYHLQIYATEAMSNDMAKLKADQISDIREGQYFNRIVEEDEKGFVYEMTIDSSNHYSFRYVHVQGDLEYLFTTALARTFSEDEAKRMYEAVQQQ